MNTEEKNFHLSEIAISVALIAFLALTAVFFLGALLPQFKEYDLSIKIPISFLIISTFGFIFSALIFSNATLTIIRDETGKTRKYLSYGYAISEYIGVYLFVLSVPLTVNIITPDTYLRSVTFMSAMAGIGMYQFMGFSLLKDYFSKSYKIFYFLTILFGTVLFFSQVYGFYFTGFAIAFLCYIFLLTFFGPGKKFE